MARCNRYGTVATAPAAMTEAATQAATVPAAPATAEAVPAAAQTPVAAPVTAQAVTAAPVEAITPVAPAEAPATVSNAPATTAATTQETPVAATAPAATPDENVIATAASAPATAAAPQPQMTVLNTAELKQLDSEKYTGVIIDATGLGMEPTFAPVIYDTEKRPIYGLKNLDYKRAMNKGMVGYASSVEAAKTLARAGSNPLILKATDAIGGPNSVNRVNAVVSVADGDRILLADQKNAMLNNASVVFVK